MTRKLDYIVVTKEFSFKGDDESKNLGTSIWLDDSATVSIKGKIFYHHAILLIFLKIYFS